MSHHYRRFERGRQRIEGEDIALLGTMKVVCQGNLSKTSVPTLVLLKFPWQLYRLEQADIVGEATETAQHAAVVAPVIVIAAFMLVFKSVQEHFSADDCGCST